MSSEISSGDLHDGVIEGNHQQAGYIVGADSEIEPTISVVLPTLDEEEGITTCIEQIRAAARRLAMPTEIIVSDSSTDRTPELARDAGAIVVEPDEPGYGYAYRYAFDRTRGDYVVMGDADTTYDFEELPRLFNRLQETDADLVMGSRLDGEIKPGSMPPLHKYVGNPLLTRFLNAFYDAGVSDAHSGFRVIDRDALDRMDLDTTGMEFASEMVMEAGAKGLEIEEVPIVYHERVGEETLDSFQDGWRHVRFMLLNAPSYLFSVPGLLLGALGSLVIVLASLGVDPGGVSFGLHSTIAGSLFVITGYQIATMGVFAAVATDPIRTPSGPVTNVVLEHGTLERCATLGSIVLGAGTVYAGALVFEWATSGFESLSFTLGSLVAFTTIVVGLQTIFAAFFLGLVDQC